MRARRILVCTIVSFPFTYNANTCRSSMIRTTRASVTQSGLIAATSIAYVYRIALCYISLTRVAEQAVRARWNSYTRISNCPYMVR